MSIGAPLVPDDAPCVSVYRRVREGIPPDSAQIGHGYNRYPACPQVEDYLLLATKACVRDRRMAEYGTHHDACDRGLAATLISRYLDLDVDDDQIVFTHGATEGIAVTMDFAARSGAGVWLPLPCYYAFEQNLAHGDGRVLGYYRADGRIHSTGMRASRTCLVEVVPNGVSGDIFTPTVGPVDVRVVDIVFQAGGSENPTAAVHAARARVSSGVDGTAVLMTPAKDLSVPGIRAGMLVSDYQPLVAAARRRHFNGQATINPVVGQLILLYLAALLLADADRAHGGFDTTFRWLGDQFTRRRVEPMPSYATCRAIVDHWTAMGRHNAVAYQILADHAAGILDTEPYPRPVAGYSVLPRLRLDLPTAEDLVGWVNSVGQRHALKLNPSLLFGGTADAWQALYPGEWHIRVNLSVPHPALAQTLATLRRATGDRHRSTIDPLHRAGTRA